MVSSTRPFTQNRTKGNFNLQRFLLIYYIFFLHHYAISAVQYTLDRCKDVYFNNELNFIKDDIRPTGLEFYNSLVETANSLRRSFWLPEPKRKLSQYQFFSLKFLIESKIGPGSNLYKLALRVDSESLLNTFKDEIEKKHPYSDDDFYHFRKIFIQQERNKITENIDTYLLGLPIPQKQVKDFKTILLRLLKEDDFVKRVLDISFNYKSEYFWHQGKSAVGVEIGAPLDRSFPNKLIVKVHRFHIANLREGQAPNHLDFTFTKVVASLFLGAIRHIDMNPQFEAIEFKVYKTVNRRVVASALNFGFVVTNVLGNLTNMSLMYLKNSPQTSTYTETEMIPHFFRRIRFYGFDSNSELIDKYIPLTLPKRDILEVLIASEASIYKTEDYVNEITSPYAASALRWVLAYKNENILKILSHINKCNTEEKYFFIRFVRSKIHFPLSPIFDFFWAQDSVEYREAVKSLAKHTQNEALFLDRLVFLKNVEGVFSLNAAKLVLDKKLFFDDYKEQIESIKTQDDLNVFIKELDKI